LKQILIRRQGGAKSGFDFEQSPAKVARFRIKPDRRRSVAVAIRAVARRAVLIVNRLAGQRSRVERIRTVKGECQQTSSEEKR
jgi:hypothetical protein